MSRAAGSTGRLAGDRGAATTSLAVVFPALLLVVMLIVQFGLWFHGRQVVTAAAQDGVRAAQVTDGSVTDGRAVAERLVTPAQGSGLLSDVSVTVTPGAGTVTVEVTARVPSLVFVPLDLTVRGHAAGPIERFVPETRRDAP